LVTGHRDRLDSNITMRLILFRLTAMLCMPLSCIAGTAWAGTLQGTASYRERMMLPPDAVFEALLQDVSRADAPAAVLGRATIDPAGQAPFRFEITYDAAAVKPSGRYAVRATITNRGRLLFTTDRIYPVLDGRSAPVELLLVSARREPSAAVRKDGLGSLPASFEGDLPGANSAIRWHLDLYPEGRFQLRTTYVDKPAPNEFDDIGRWSRDAGSGRIVLRGGREAPVFLLPVDGGAALRKLDLQGKPVESAHNDRLLRQPQFAPIDPRLFLTGMFTYMADAANIVLCADGRSVPVAMEADYKAVEAAYVQARSMPGERLLVSVEGLLAARPSMEESQPPRTTLVVERFVGVWPGQRCGGTSAATSRAPKK
jgi:uncharacterized lipoprotein YbaY/uncharacterized lipoprotein NlpE involved in copper resistance